MRLFFLLYFTALIKCISYWHTVHKHMGTV
uniref:Uncharacterized protein n=1 Tax=Anguilla anguilla TaxID=7936 RepID=A0A0E9XCJ7_ANGAN